MPEVTVIVHGWSDCSESFRDVKRFLVQHGIGNVKTILYADYESREDSVTFNDVGDGLNDEFVRNGFIDANGRVGILWCDAGNAGFLQDSTAEPDLTPRPG